jgi:hypothetical protein
VHTPPLMAPGQSIEGEAARMDPASLLGGSTKPQEPSNHRPALSSTVKEVCLSEDLINTSNFPSALFLSLLFSCLHAKSLSILIFLANYDARMLGAACPGRRDQGGKFLGDSPLSRAVATKGPYYHWLDLGNPADNYSQPNVHYSGQDHGILPSVYLTISS